MQEGQISITFSEDAAHCIVDVHNADLVQVQQIGTELGRLVHGGELLLLSGQLGAGKTTFTQALAKGMHVTDVVNSPTFTILKEYLARPKPPVSVTTDEGKHSPLPFSTQLALYHFDLYRLDDPDEMFDLGFEDYLYNAGTGVCVVEWAEKASDFWPADRLTLHLTVVDEQHRRLLFTATGTRYCTLLQQLQKNIYAITGS